MSRSKVEGTKIAQAAKDLNVTSVTIRRYIQEFNIETATDENGIKVLPKRALDELQEIRRLKEDGLTNPKVMEHLEEMRSSSSDKEEKTEKKGRAIKAVKQAPKSRAKEKAVEVEEEAEEEQEEEKPEPRRPAKKPLAKRIAKEEVEEESEVTSTQEAKSEEDGEGAQDAENGDNGEPGKSQVMHQLTCQTCSKTFEHVNPRLRDCLECYRTKRKERRRGGGDKHKNVIQNPIAQQVLSKSQAPSRENREGRENGNGEVRERSERPDRSERPERSDRSDRFDRSDRSERQERPDRVAAAAAAAAARSAEPSAWAQLQKPVRSYRKAIEETRLITGSLKRRLERPDLPEGERRWLEQIYAYQLILHQGWRHLAEYKSGGTGQSKPQED